MWYPLELSIGKSFFFKWWSYKYAKNYMATLLRMVLPYSKCNSIKKRLIQHCSCLFIRLLILLDPHLLAKWGLMKAPLPTIMSVSQNYFLSKTAERIFIKFHISLWFPKDQKVIKPGKTLVWGKYLKHP